MIILSLFDGMSCGQIALNKAGIKIDKYYASEIDKYAIQVTQANYPNTIQLGSIIEWKTWDIEKPDIIIGGSPCQGFSFAGKQLNFDDPRSKLFFVFADILKHYKPKYFLLENVIMDKASNDVISSMLGEIYPECVRQGDFFRTGRLEPMEINSALVSAQNRRRLYWFNWHVEQPKDKGILLKDIIEDGLPSDKNPNFNYKSQSNSYFELDEKMQNLSAGTHGYANGYVKAIIVDKINNSQDGKIFSVNGKSQCLSAGHSNYPKIIESNYRCDNPTNINKDKFPCLRSQAGEKTKGIGLTENDITWRKLTPIECERLQTVPDNYTKGVSNIQRYKMLGNGWTVDVIAHILSGIK